jgi:hypothetical protein
VKTSPKRSYSVIENERFRLVFAKTGSIISGTTSFIDEICARELKHLENQFSYIVGYFDAEPVRLETCCSKYAFAANQAYGGHKLN